MGHDDPMSESQHQLLTRLSGDFYAISQYMARVATDLSALDRVLAGAVLAPRHGYWAAPGHPQYPAQPSAPQPAASEPEPAQSYPAQPYPAQPEPAQPEPVSQPQPIAEPQPAVAPEPAAERNEGWNEGWIGKLLAVAGVGVTLTGVVLLLVLAAQAGILRPEFRVAGGVALAAGLVAVAIRLKSRPGGLVGAVALAATGIAAGYMDVIAVTTIYKWFPAPVGLIVAALIGGGGLTLARLWDSQHLGVLVFVPPDLSCADEIESFCAEAAARINRVLHLHAVMAFGEPVPRIRDVPLAFERAKQAAGLRLLDNANQIIRMEREMADQEEAAELRYSFTLERELLQALRTGDEDGARAHLEAFLGSLCGGGAKEIDVQQGMLQLLGQVQHAMMASGFHPHRLYGGANLYAELSRLREPKQMLRWFMNRVLAPYFREWASRADARVKRLAGQAAEYLHRNYMRDISLESCADALGTSPYALSKAFKAATGTNFIDYLTELRVEKAKQLLRESELKIHDVAGMVGYQHSYFNRIFKKLEGITPTLYRQRSRNA